MHVTLNTLFDLGLSTKESLLPFSKRVRDRDDVGAMLCQRSGVIVLDRVGHLATDAYDSKAGFSYWNAGSRASANAALLDDTDRRARLLQNIIPGKIWADIGTGSGAILDRIGSVAQRTLAVEPQEDVRRSLADAGYETYRAICDLPYGVQVASLFHSFEHMTDPVGELRNLKERMVPGGLLIIEVPHARDLLLSHLGVSSFKDFTLWSEHIILHTRQSLKAFIEAAGFTNTSIQGVQRYPISNHFGWLKNGRPGGHVEMAYLNSPALTAAYEDTLARIDATDTLVAWAHMPV